MIYYSCKSEALRTLLQTLDDFFGEAGPNSPALRRDRNSGDSGRHDSMAAVK